MILTSWQLSKTTGYRMDGVFSFPAREVGIFSI